MFVLVDEYERFIEHYFFQCLGDSEEPKTLSTFLEPLHAFLSQVKNWLGTSTVENKFLATGESRNKLLCFFFHLGVYSNFKMLEFEEKKGKFIQFLVERQHLHFESFESSFLAMKEKAAKKRKR